MYFSVHQATCERYTKLDSLSWWQNTNSQHMFRCLVTRCHQINEMPTELRCTFQYTKPLWTIIEIGKSELVSKHQLPTCVCCLVTRCNQTNKVPTELVSTFQYKPAQCRPSANKVGKFNWGIKHQLFNQGGPANEEDISPSIHQLSVIPNRKEWNDHRPKKPWLYR